MALNFKTSQNGYVLINGKIENYIYSEFLREFGSDETTTPIGIAPRLYVDGNSIMTWGVRGNNHAFYASFKNKREATATLYEIWEQNVLESCYGERFFKTKKDLFEDCADMHNVDTSVVKRYFRLQEFKIENAKNAKIKYDNRPLFTKEMMIEFINNNREMVLNSLIDLKELKEANNKEVWQVKANALVQKVSNNDFRVLNWKDVYKLIYETV